MRSKHSTNDKHHDSHPHRTSHQRLLATDEVDSYDEEDGSCYDLDSTVDTGCEERRRALRDTDCLEDLRSVIPD